MSRLNTLRRASQIIFLILIVYIGVIGLQNLGIALDASSQQENDDIGSENIMVASATGYNEVLNTYGPVKTCRYIAGDTRTFRGCSLHYFSKTLTTFASLNFAFVLPHVLLFFVLAFLFGRLFCGWMCPLGFLEEVMIFCRKRLGFRHLKLSESVKSHLAKLRYVLLSIIIILSLAIAIPMLGLAAYQKELYIAGCQICPARVLLPFIGGLEPVIYSFTSPIIIFISSIGLVFLGLYLSGCVFRRPWCRICPSGAMLSLFNSGSMLSKEKDVRKCTKCGICSRVCALDNKNVYLEKENKNISTANCIRCFKCIERCPERDCLTLKLFGKTLYRSGSRMR